MKVVADIALTGLTKSELTTTNYTYLKALLGMIVDAKKIEKFKLKKLSAMKCLLVIFHYSLER